MTYTRVQYKYLELMVLALTRIAFGEGGQPVDERRYRGADWPLEAETMIGVQRLWNIADCVGVVVDAGVAGDVCECGVWRGGASIMMKAALTAFGDKHRTVWVCDSFQGLPKPDPRYPADDGDVHHTYDVLAVSQDQVRANFERYRLLDGRVRFVPGFFEDTLPGPIKQLAVLRLDGDMYSSTIHTLDALYPLVSPGGFVIVDDYGGVGCRQAVEFYRESHNIHAPLQPIEDDSGAVFWRNE